MKFAYEPTLNVVGHSFGQFASVLLNSSYSSAIPL